MRIEVIQGVLLPFLGTILGAGCVFFMRGGLRPMLQRALTGFAAGVMVAASIWSLLVPWASCFCWRLTGRSPTSTRTAASPRASTPS